MKRRSVIITIFLFVFLSSVSFSAERYLDYEDSNFSKIILPLTFSMGLPVVKVKIQNKVLKLIVDTGADLTYIALKPDKLKLLETELITENAKSTDVYGSSYTIRQKQIPELYLGKLKVRDLMAREEARSFVPEDGIIGNMLLKKFHLLLDYRNAQLVLYSTGKPYPENLNLNEWGKIGFEHNDMGIILQGKMLAFEKELKFVLDTGSSSANNGEPCGLLLSKYFPGLKGIIYFESPQLNVGGQELGKMGFQVVNFEEPPVDGFLGNVFFLEYKVFIDFGKNTLWIKKY